MEGPHPTGWRLSLVLPAYNEEAGVRQAVVEADEALAELCHDYEVLVVDDGSTDSTAAVVTEEAARRPRVRLLRHEGNRGYGAALRTGFESARFDLVAFTDSDCQFHLGDLADLLPHTAQAPVVVGFRLGRQDPWRRRFLSRGYNLLARALLGTRVRDCDCALKVFRAEALARLLPESAGFFVNTEMLTRARQLGLGVVEVGVRHRPRLRGTSTVSLREVPRTLGRLLPFWWSRVLFAGPAACGLAGRAARPQAALPALALLLLLACLLFFARLRAPLLEPQEARYAEIPRQMLAEGRLLVPVLHGEPYLDKPPLLYWLVMGSYRCFGVHDWAARLVPGVAGVLTVLLTYLWGRRAVGARPALAGALVLCLSAGFVYRQRMLTFDSLLGMWVTASLACAHVALAGPALRRGWWLASAGACALGLLTKGPVALVLVLGPLVAFRLLDPRCPRVGARAWFAFLGVAAGLAGPWYVAVIRAEPGFASSFFWRHNVVRFVAPFDHAKPFWYYLPGLLLGLLPWALLLPGFASFLARRSARAAARRPSALGFFLLSALGCLVFFSASGCKRPTYVLPALPPLALALGCYLACLSPPGVGGAARQALWQRGSRLAHQATGLALGLALGCALLAFVMGLVKAHVGLALAAVALGGLGGWLLCPRRLSWAGCTAVTFTALFVGVLFLQPAYNQQFSLRGQLRRHARLADGRPLPVVCYPQHWDSVSFYLPGADVTAYDSGQRRRLLEDLGARPDSLLVVKSGPALEGLLRDLRAGVEVLPRGRSGALAVLHVRARATALARR